MTDGSAFGVWNYAINISFTIKGLETEFEQLLTIWTVIDFSSNQFYGEIPKTLGELHSLIVLNLSHNCLTGHIPSSLGDMSELESLDLSSNKLHGRIPTELKNLRFLAVLNFSKNNLMGPIPQGKQFDTFTNDSYLGNLGLCGLPLSKSCDSDEGTPAKPDRDDDDGMNWKFSILMGYGCGLVLGLTTAYIVFKLKDHGGSLRPTREFDKDLQKSHFKHVKRAPERVFLDGFLPLKDFLSKEWHGGFTEEKWMVIFKDIRDGDILWRASWNVSSDILYICGERYWIPFPGIWGSVGYAPLLVSRQYESRQFILATRDLSGSDFAFKGEQYKGKVKGIAEAWKQTCRVNLFTYDIELSQEYKQ
ncbi:putative receptor like protein 25 [Hibiscus syriacus]|uniref:putative receptor like protein 25 n=1 Tax=Hibiscus syriacus TaxID=106335 RepID=UPI001924F1E3|nr:putative receptor like protein 25 [Hibiscus syriacus]